MPKLDIHQEITDQIISLLEKVDLKDYKPPFAGLVAQGLPVNPKTRKQYNGINILSLWFNQQNAEFNSNKWATYKQWQELDAQVRKGEKSSNVIFYKQRTETELDDKGEEKEFFRPIMRLYRVFNASQVDNFDDLENTPNESDLVTPCYIVEQFCKSTGANIKRGQLRAYYDQIRDYIGMPDTIAFQDTGTASATENYYSTLLHELTHWTGSKKRLGRFELQREKNQDYAFEELVAELGAAFLCASLGITQSGREDHAMYIKGWLKALEDDKKHIFKAAAQANQAVEYLNSLQRQ
jgi:antirestriction protein ArdC